MFKKIPNYVKYIFTNVFFLFVYIFIFRVLFYYLFAQLENVTSSEIKTAFLLGFRFDIKLAVMTFFPIAIFILITNYKFFKRKIYQKIATFYLVLAYLILTLFFLFDFGYYDYLSIRLDASSLRFLSNIGISSEVLIESYPVYKGVFALLVLCFLIYKFSNFLFNRYKNQLNTFNKKIKAIYFAATFLLLSFGIYNSFTHYPLRWSEAFFSKNNAVNQFSLNPVLYFFDSFAYRSEGVNMDEFNTYYPVIAKHLGLPKDSVSFERKVVFDSTYTKKPNIVIVMMESVGVKPISYYGNPIKTTPNLDSIIKSSVSFSNFYVHKSGTAASVFASVTGLPDIENVRTASRNPLIIDQRILFDQFTGYEKLYFLGGSANWANIRGIFQSNIKQLQIFEEGSYKTEKRADVWGIDDYELFKESNKELEKLSKQEKPFIAYIQTASNHMPFTVPDTKESYKPLKDDEISSDLLKKSGFKSVAQLNALRYLDFNIGRFLERAKTSGYYDNTIFVFFGDHNTAMKRTDLFPKEYDLNIQLQHVPFLIHAPKYIKPKVISNTGKLIDLFPTVASLAKINHTNYTLGSNLLDSTNIKDVGFVYLKTKGEPAVGLIKDSLYLNKTMVTNTLGLYNLKEKELIDLKEKYPLLTKKMDSLLSAYYHSTKYLYFNNKKLSE
ncbi:sulfatase-like hydrolase/transferase [Polaribacter sp. MSW13]|uniref:Sulfatase-like hydrolase/transferase n=1 Tax=Polaribacter marinus TaxID=2916838 RepID=A0A9X1VKU9_9FLAO|nr:alkaline phosphatase family protein [Polaribacter marinus]MCI2228006.1 sulfatase-like hydrolase/transferase [Polaribacter marinus]